MRKVNDIELLRMKADNIPQKQIAEHFSVSPAFICKRLKQLKPVAIPESLQNLTEQERNFTIRKASGMSNIAAAFESYNVSSRDSAKAISNDVIKRPHVQAAIRDWLSFIGMHPEFRAQKLFQCANSPDLSIALKALEQSHRIMGDMTGDKIEFNISEVEIRALVAMINPKPPADIIQAETV